MQLPPLNSAKPARHRRGRKLLWLLAAVCLIISGSALWWLGSTASRISRFAPIARTLPDEIRAAHESGIPLTPDDLRVGTDIPDSQNAAIIYRKIHEILQKQPKEQREAEGKVVSDFLSSHGEKGDRQQIEAILRARSEEIGLAEQAARFPRCEYHRRFEDGEDILFPEYSEARHLARLLSARSRIRADRGELPGAFEDIRVGAAISNHVAQDRILIGMLVSVAVSAIMDQALMDVVKSHRDDPRILGLFRTANGAFGPVPDVKRFFQGELVISRIMIGHVWERPGGVSTLLQKLRLSSKEDSQRVRGMMCDAWEVRLLQYWREVFADLRKNQNGLLGELETMKRAEKRMQSHAGQPTYELNEELMPIYSQTVSALIRMQVQRDLRDASLRLLDYRKAQGRFPGVLSDLPGALPRDLYTESPFRYSRSGTGFLLYSVGDNRKDDRGNSDKDPKTKKPLDIVIRL
jgi:hypothetical protein